VLELLWLLGTTVLAWVRPRQDLVLENLLLCHQRAVLTWPTRSRPRARLRAWDKLLWILARCWCAGWREQLAIVTPDTVVRWHRQGWRLFWRWKLVSWPSSSGMPTDGPDYRWRSRRPAMAPSSDASRSSSASSQRRAGVSMPRRQPANQIHGRTTRHFHPYSFSNTLLILAQLPSGAIAKWRVNIVGHLRSTSGLGRFVLGVVDIMIGVFVLVNPRSALRGFIPSSDSSSRLAVC
jgi:hypothetical protein